MDDSILLAKACHMCPCTKQINIDEAYPTLLLLPMVLFLINDILV